MPTYSEKLKDPRWQKMRLKVLDRDDWACQICGDNESTLHVHHRYYKKGCNPWDYPMESLVVLCEGCHDSEREGRKGVEATLLDAMREKFFASDVLDFAIGIHFMKFCFPPEVVASAFSWAFQQPELQKMVIDAYINRRTRKIDKGFKTKSSEAAAK